MIASLRHLPQHKVQKMFESKMIVASHVREYNIFDVHSGNGGCKSVDVKDGICDMRFLEMWQLKPP